MRCQRLHTMIASLSIAMLSACNPGPGQTDLHPEPLPCICNPESAGNERSSVDQPRMKSNQSSIVQIIKNPDILINMPQFIDHGDGTVSDSFTGLMWQQNPTEKRAWQAAKSTQPNYAGYHDWRLPNVKELYSLLNLTESAPYVDEHFFNLPDGLYWSATQYPTGGFSVNFNLAQIESIEGNNASNYTLYVRGNSSYGQNDFVNTNSGTVIDQVTDLTWMQYDSAALAAEPMTWQEAVTWCEASTFNGYSDWRLPNAKELLSLVDYPRLTQPSFGAPIDPLFDSTLITDESGQDNWPFYWTRNTDPADNNKAIYLAFGSVLNYVEFPATPGSYQLVQTHERGTLFSSAKAGKMMTNQIQRVERKLNMARCLRNN